MKTTVDFYDFKRAFDAVRPENFTYEGLEILFNGLEEFEEDTGEEMELDVIAICCDFYEMDEDELKRSYPEFAEGGEEWLNNQTWLLGKTEKGSYVFRQF